VSIKVTNRVSVLILLFLTLWASAAAAGGSGNSSGSDGSYYKPYSHDKSMPNRVMDRKLSCDQLDREISRVTSYTYNYRTDFDRDPYAGGSIIAGATVPLIGYAYPIFSFVRGFAEDNRIQTAQSRIEHLRRLKAEKYCYEERI
jgi:hypothetical protein